MTQLDQDNREVAARRLAYSRGWALKKNPRRQPEALNHSGYMLVDVETGMVIDGGTPMRYFLSLEDVEQVLQPA